MSGASISSFHQKFYLQKFTFLYYLVFKLEG